ncbi:collagen alpha-1(I) chain-like [Lutra lutra]|uniref:collagen alpha-1(I) chain-like n=1 Tax=Lutra lutra TaxID=9657 RepID=UPI001FD04240|nr:collagen alpha-1(I) chain-like [Lutra lutra]
MERTAQEELAKTENTSAYLRSPWDEATSRAGFQPPPPGAQRQLPQNLEIPADLRGHGGKQPSSEQAQASPGRARFWVLLLRAPPGPGAGDTALQLETLRVVSPQTGGAPASPAPEKGRARWPKERRWGRRQPARAAGRGRCGRRGHVEVGGAGRPGGRRRALGRGAGPPTAGPRARVPEPTSGSTAIATLPGPLAPPRRARSPGGPGALEESRQKARSARRDAHRRGLSLGTGKAPRRVPGAGAGGVPGLDLSSPTLPAGRARRSHAAADLRRRERASRPGTRRPAASHRPPARRPAPAHRAPKFRPCGPLGGLGPALPGEREALGRSRGRGAGRMPPAPAFRGPGDGVAGRSRAARKVRASHFSRFPRCLPPTPSGLVGAHVQRRLQRLPFLSLLWGSGSPGTTPLPTVLNPTQSHRVGTSEP